MTLMTDTASAKPPVSLRLFGPFEASVNGVSLPSLQRRKDQWLLALLALRGGKEVERAWLAALLWPDSEQPQALSYVRMAVYALRQALGTEADCLRSITRQAPGVGATRRGPAPRRMLSLDLARVLVDVTAFDAAVVRGDPASLASAVALYRGSLLEGCDEEWVFEERHAREQTYLQARLRLASLARAGNEFSQAEAHLRAVIAVDPLREEAQRALMETLFAAGSYTAAVTVYQELQAYLRREQHSDPDPKTTDLYRRIRAETRAKQRTVAGPTRSSEDAVPGPTASPALSCDAELEETDDRLPGGTLTFLGTDIEGSTGLWERAPKSMRSALARHDEILVAAIESHGGQVFKKVGDGLWAVFAAAPAGIAAALAAQRSLLAERWELPPETGGGSLRVRMALSTGEAHPHEGDYSARVLNRASRLLAAGHGGQILLSLATHELVWDNLPEGSALKRLGEYRLRDLPRPEPLFQLLHPELPAVLPPLRAPSAAASVLSPLLTRFIGREREQRDLRDLLEGHRLVTLTGMGGSGKTRLALQIADQVAQQHPDGVRLARLEALIDGTLLAQTVAAAVGVNEAERSPLTALVEFLGSRTLLLVLDNCEHLLTDCAALVDEMLRHCPGLRVLATSRGPLGIPGEFPYSLSPLSLPVIPFTSPAGDGSAETLLQSEAAQLFVDRARLADPHFTLTDSAIQAVAQVCRRLDGIPLALELAAARLRLLSVEQILKRLDDRFRLLSAGNQTALPRQQALRASIDWSYDLLSRDAQTLFQRLAIFAGSFTLEAVEQICALDLADALAPLMELANQSLLTIAERGEEARYRLQETIREYAREKLRAAGEEVLLGNRHRDAYLERAEEAAPHLAGPDRPTWREELERDGENLRAALAWSIQHGEAAPALRLATALWRLWRGRPSEGRQWLAAALSLPGAEAPTLARARALNAAGALAHDQSALAEATSLHTESLALAKELGDRETVAESLNHLGNAWRDQGMLDDAERAYRESLQLWRAAHDRDWVGRVLNNLGNVALDRGCDADAIRFFEESLQIKRALGDAAGEAVLLNNLADLYLGRGEHGRAEPLLQESLRLFERLGERHHLAVVLDTLGDLLLSRGDAAGAAQRYRECLSIGREVESPTVAVMGLEGLAASLAIQGNLETAARLFAAAAAQRAAVGVALPDGERADHEARIAAARGRIAPAVWEQSWSDGEALSIPEAIELGLAVTIPSASLLTTTET
jgi:predicted ATPase/class 3 adenylate cyclase